MNYQILIDLTLNDDIKHLIYSKIIYNQPPILLNDIRSFYKSKKQLLQHYHNIYIIQYEQEINEDMYWLLNDLIGYCNKNKPLMKGIDDNFRNIIKRLKYVKNEYINIQKICSSSFFSNIIKILKKNEDNHIQKIFNLNFKTQINLLLALLTDEERQHFIKNIKNI